MVEVGSVAKLRMRVSRERKREKAQTKAIREFPSIKSESSIEDVKAAVAALLSACGGPRGLANFAVDLFAYADASSESRLRLVEIVLLSLLAIENQSDKMSSIAFWNEPVFESPFVEESELRATIYRNQFGIVR